MKNILWSLLMLLSLNVSAQLTGSEIINYNIGNDRGSATVTAIRGTQNVGTVTGFSVASANGFTGTSNGNANTPILTIATSISGMLKGSSNALVAATVGTDYTAGTAALGTGILKNTTGTGAHTIAIASDFPTLNQNTSGNAATATLAATVTTNANLTGPITSVGNTTTIGAGAVTNSNLANSAITVDGVSVALGTAFTQGSITVTATGTDAIGTRFTICNAAASDITRTLPPSPPDGHEREYVRSNSTAGNTIIVPNSGQTISSGANIRLISAGRAVTLKYHLATTTWFEVQ